MSDIGRVSLSYQGFRGGELIELKNITICPEKITLRGSGGGLRLDIVNYDGSNLAWFLLPTEDLSVELS